MRFILLVEGRTEHRVIGDFLGRWLNPQLRKRVGMDVVNLKNFGAFKNKAAERARDYLGGGEGRHVIAVIGLLDLYGPDRSDFYPLNKQSADERYDWGVAYFEQQVDNPSRFRMFFAVHELEAWLLSQPSVLPREVAERVARDRRDPEKVNFNRPPAKMLRESYTQELHREYKKTVDGPRLFAQLDPETARQRCPHLKRLLDDMLALAKKAGLG
jgi:hypothetical protein